MSLQDVTPNFTSIRNLYDISKILAWPILAVAYFFISGPQVGYGGDVWLGILDELPLEDQTQRFFLIFFLKSLYIAFLAAVVYEVVGQIHAALFIYKGMLVFPFIAAFLFALAILGIFGKDKFIWLKDADGFWPYAAIVWGFFFLSMTEQLKERLKRHP